jgi:hypothetical protein
MNSHTAPSVSTIHKGAVRERDLLAAKGEQVGDGLHLELVHRIDLAAFRRHVWSPCAGRLAARI